MADTRLPDRWLMDPRWVGLSDRALRTLVQLHMLANGRESDGEVPAAMFYLTYPGGIDDATLQELVENGWVELYGASIHILDWTDTQTSHQEMEDRREINRLRQARWRARKKAELEVEKAAANAAVEVDGSDQSAADDVTHDSRGESLRESRSVSRVTSRVSNAPRRKGKDRQGEERPGQARTHAHANESSPPVTEWETRKPGELPR